MILRLISQTTITQLTAWSGGSRSETFTMNFVNEIEIESSWENQTDTAKITLPKKVYFVNSQGKRVTWSDKNIINGNGTEAPIIMRGDKIEISFGYIYTKNGMDVIDMSKEFSGFITKVIPRIPIQIECEDDMYLLKQIQAPNKTWLASKYDLEGMLAEMLTGTQFAAVTGVKVSNKISTKIGTFITHNETVAQVLERLKKEAHFNAYIRRNSDGTKELRCGSIVYYPKDQKEIVNGVEVERDFVFDFQKNIIDDDLEFRRKDDINIRIRAISKLENQLTTTNSSGGNKKTIKQIEVTVPTSRTPLESELRTMHFYNLTKEELTKRANTQLNRLFYEGFKGGFTTFGIPSVRHGDRITLVDKKVLDRAGTSLCKGVTKTFGQGGIRQKIKLDMRIDGLNSSEIEGGL